LSTKDLKYQIVERRIEKLAKRFIGPYKIKKIMSSNVVELELPSTIKIHPVVNVSRIQRYVGQVEGQRKEQPAPVNNQRRRRIGDRKNPEQAVSERQRQVLGMLEGIYGRV